MKVLMFGWEFPPHISGGLGTACYGLTKSLMKARVAVRFVVPTVFGDQPGKDTFLVNASRVGQEKRTRALKEKRSAMARRAAGPSIESFRETTWQGMDYVQIPSGLSPYGHPDAYTAARQEVNAPSDILSWNYSIASARDVGRLRPDPKPGTSTITEQEAQANGTETFQFSGTYGKNLMEEVRRYGTVASRIAEQYRFDVIHVHDWMTFPAGVMAKKISGKPLIVHVHSTEFDRAGERINADVLEIEKLGFSNADAIIAVSNWTRQIIISRYDIPGEKIKVVHNGILPKAKPETFAFPNIGSHFVTFLGRVTHQKGPWYFVEAARKVLEEFPDAHFIVAGAGDLLPQIIERVAQLNMGTRFHFTGFLSGNQVDQIWSLTDVYVMPSVSEPFGIAPLEAIQGDVPVILSNQSGVAEVMPHAMKVDFWDTKALAAAICSVLRYESLSVVLRQKSKQQIEHLTWDKAARDVKELYHELIGNK